MNNKLQFTSELKEALGHITFAIQTYVKNNTQTQEELAQLHKLQTAAISLLEVCAYQTTPDVLNRFSDDDLSRYLFTIQQLINIRKNV